MLIRSRISDDDEIWRVLQPTIRAGETLALPREMTHKKALSYSLPPTHEVFVVVIS